jgi:hypothetical protein
MAPRNDFGLSLPPPTPCCVDAARGTCGTISQLGGTKCTPVGIPDARCPSAVNQDGTVLFAGCCIAGDCGLDMTYGGRGCVDDSDSMAAIYVRGSMPLLYCDGSLRPTGPTP